jgi:hypothetical protein
MSQVMKDRRAVERDRMAAGAGTREAIALLAESRRLRDEYECLMEAALSYYRPALAPFTVAGPGAN